MRYPFGSEHGINLAFQSKLGHSGGVYSQYRTLYRRIEMFWKVLSSNIKVVKEHLQENEFRFSWK